MDLIQRVREAGVVGAGGAGFPTHVKMAAKAEYLIINGAECEPLLRVDQQLMKADTRDIISGIKLVMAAIEAKEAFIAIKGKHKEAIQTVRDCIDDPCMSVFPLVRFLSGPEMNRCLHTRY